MSAPAHQMPLNLGCRTAMGREDFLVSPSNESAVAWIDKWPDWPAPVLVLYGPEASGKTHLMTVWQDRSKALPVESLARDGVPNIAAQSEHFVIDGADIFLAGNAQAQQGLFHLYNLCREEGRSILLTADRAVKEWDITLPDLRSRLQAAPAVAIDKADDMLLQAVLVKLFSDRQLVVGEDVIKYILPRMERSMSGARDLVTRVDEAALSQKRAISVPLVKSVMEREND